MLASGDSRSSIRTGSVLCCSLPGPEGPPEPLGKLPVSTPCAGFGLQIKSEVVTDGEHVVGGGNSKKFASG